MTSVSFTAEPNDERSASEEKSLNFYWQQFNSQFRAEQDCVDELYRRFHEIGAIRCKHCGSHDVQHKPGARVIKCSLCKKTTWFLAGTFFNRIRLVRPWLTAIWLMERGARFNSSQLEKLITFTYSSTLNIFKKVTTVIESLMEAESLVVPSALFAPAVCKRSRETPAREHPLAEQEELEKQRPDNAAVSQPSCKGGQRLVLPPVEASDSGSSHDKRSDMKPCTLSDEKTPTSESTLAELERKVYEILSNQPAHFDSICQQTKMSAAEMSAALMLLELNGLAKRMPGDRYLRFIPRQSSGSSKSVDKSTMKIVSTIVDYVRVTFHGVSRKCLQNYLAAHWCHIDRTRWHSGSLLQECIRFRAVSYAEILDYVSPLFLKIPIDIGKPSQAVPVTPPCIRVRTRRFGGISG